MKKGPLVKNSLKIIENFKGELSEAGAVPSTKPSLFSKGKGLAQLFEGRLALNLGLNLTLVSFSYAQKHFVG